MENGNLFDSEMLITTARGNERWIRITGQPEYSGGQCNRIYGAIQDITEKRNTEQSLTESRNQLQSLIQSVNGIFWEADAQAFEFSFVSDHVKDILGYTPEQWLGERYFWENHIHPDDLQQAVSYCQIQVNNHKDHTFDYRMIKADGSIIWIKDVVSVIVEEGRPTCLRGLMVDITETKIIEELSTLEKSVLELNATNDTALNEVLAIYLKGIEVIFPGMQCSLHMIKENCLEFGLAPSLPTAYLELIRNAPVGPSVGSCGTAAFLKEKVIVTDIANDPRWFGYSEFALRYNLRACWSQPIISSDGIVMATLGFYYNRVKSPQENELLVIDRCAAILKVILENRQTSILLEESSMMMKQGQEIAAFGNWQWDILNNVVKWSDELYKIYGLDKTKFKATFEGYQELLHPNDRERIRESILLVLENKTDIVFEERIIRPNGEIRHLKSWGRLQSDEKGIPVKMVGACLDITESKKVQEQLLASQSRLKNIVDAQTNYVMRTDLAGNYTYYNNKYREDFGWIFGVDNLYGKSPMATIIPAHYQRVNETFEKSIQNPNQVFQVELDKISPDGGIRSTFWHFICLTDTNGEPFEIQCIGLDITDKKRAEDELKRSNERYQYVNKATNDAIYDWNSETNHIRWGEGFTRLFGFELHEGQTYPIEKWKIQIHASDREKVSESLNKALSDVGQSRWQSAYQFRKKSGKYAFVQENAYILRDVDGNAVRMIGVLRDVTKQKQEEHHLKLLESVITHANDLVIIAEADPSDKTALSILYINEAFTRITGYRMREVIGRNTSLFTGYDLSENDSQKIISAVKNGVSLQLETSLSKKNGSQFWISLSLNPIEDEKGHITHWVSIGRDITESRRYTKAIEQQNEKLKDIAFMQSHVVRAPLARLMGAVDLMKNYNNSEQENKQFLDHVLASAHELDGIIRDISEKAKSDPWVFMK